MLNPIRTIITQDAEVDDQNSLRHILLYANDIEIQKDINPNAEIYDIGFLKTSINLNSFTFFNLCANSITKTNA